MKARGLLRSLALLLLPVLSCGPPRSSSIVIGAKNFTEQVVLGELLAQHIESTTGLKVERRFYLAGSYIAHQALIAGRIDAYVEYTGTALSSILKQPLDTDPSRVREIVSRLYRERYQVAMMPSLGFENSFAMIVRPEQARQLSAPNLSAAVADAAQWRLGVGYEFEERPDGLPRLTSIYGIHFAGGPRTMDLGLLYRALSAHQVDVIAGNSTDGPIQVFGLTVLADDRHAFPPYEAVPLVRQAALDRWPQMGTAIQELAGKVSAEDMRAMNHEVDGEHRDVSEVVKEYREKKGL